MKKGLFLLPLAGALVLSGCTFSLFGKEITLFEKEEKKSSSGGSGGSGSGGSGGGGSGGGGEHTPEGGGEKGTGLSTVTLYNKEDIVDSTASPLEFTDKGCKVTVSIGGNTANTLAEAVEKSGYYEFRVYAKFGVKVEADTSFTKLEVLYSTYKSGTSTYYWNFQIEGATLVTDNEYDTEHTTGKATYTFASGVTQFDFGNVSHQSRVRSFTFLAA